MKKFEDEVEYAEWIELESKKNKKYNSWKKVELTTKIVAHINKTTHD